MEEREEQHQCECECGKHKGKVEYVIDPFQEDIYGETEWRWLCERCYEDLAMDI